MLVVVFDDESKAYEGSSALAQLDSKGSISIHAEAVIKKNVDGTITVKQSGDNFPVRAAVGTAIGALIGVLGGPIGLGIGIATGTAAGAVLDVGRTAGVNAKFLKDVSNKLTPGKWAVVSDISEESETPIDARMEALGGFVYRAALHDAKHEENARKMAAIRADIAQLKTELAKSRKENKVKLQAKIGELQEKLRAVRNQAKERSAQQEREAKAKVQALKKKAAKSKGEAKATIEARIAEIRKKVKESKERSKELAEDETPS
jgi:uncharacterized membrane protein